LKYLVDEKDISNFTLRITDDKNREIDFNNCDWYLTFQIDYIYRTIPIKNSLSRFIKNNNFIRDYIKSLEDLKTSRGFFGEEQYNFSDE